MDYIEAFANLRTNNKWGRKSPHKAVLMLTVIEMFEKNILSENKIYYDDQLKSMFINVWNKVMPNESFFHPDAYLPFWYLQNDNFWHIVPLPGKDDILSLMRDNDIKPSETKLYDSVSYAELDDDLYFLMTISSGRSSLKRVLLSYTNLSDNEIDLLSESADNIIDSSATALAEYKDILSQGEEQKLNINETISDGNIDKELVFQFLQLEEDVQLELNVQYFTFLKKHRNVRAMFKDVCHSVYDLYNKIVNPIKYDEISPSFAFLYQNFLSDLKISLMSENGTAELIDQINEAIKFLSINKVEEKDKAIDESPDTNNQTIETTSKRSYESRATKDILTGYELQRPPTQNFHEADGNKFNFENFVIENTGTRAFIENEFGAKIFIIDGYLKSLGRSLYRLNMKDPCFTIKAMQFNGRMWMKGDKKIVAYPDSPLYGILRDVSDYTGYIEEIIDRPLFENCQVKVKGVWYNYKGEVISDNMNPNISEEDNGLSLIEKQRIMNRPLYAIKRQAILQAMRYFVFPAKVRDIARSISMSAWRSSIKESDVEDILKTLDEVENINGKYIIRR